MEDPASFLTRHMAAHIVVMNIAAPFLVILFRRVAVIAPNPASARWIGPATAVQIALLWGWHLPAPLAFAYAVLGALMLMHVSLFGAALWFWWTVLEEAESARWRALGALLITGKVFCLLGVLLTFAPRALFVRAAELCLGAGTAAGSLLQDQQLAGLLMLVACPLTYVLAGVVIAARWLGDIERRGPSLLPDPSV